MSGATCAWCEEPATVALSTERGKDGPVACAKHARQHLAGAGVYPCAICRRPLAKRSVSVPGVGTTHLKCDPTRLSSRVED